MILATILTIIAERSSKNMSFHPTFAWPPATYDVISRNHSNWPSLNLTQNLREGWTNNYWKRQELMFYPQGKNSKKKLFFFFFLGGGWWWHPMSIRCVTRHSVRDRRGAAQLCFVTEIAPKSPFLYVNRSPILCDFCGSAKAIRYSVNMALTLQSNLQYGWNKWKICWVEPWRGWRMLFSGPFFAHLLGRKHTRDSEPEHNKSRHILRQVSL